MNRFIFKTLLLGIALGLSTGCAILHQFQLSSIDSNTVLNGQKFEIIVSETGVNLQEATDAAKLFTQNQGTRDQMQEIQNFIALFQMGPRTGNMVFNEKYADSIMRAI